MGDLVIGALLSGLFSLLLTLIATILQVIMLPLNALFNGLFPDFSSTVNQVVQAFSDAMSGLGWAISIIPPVVRTSLLFIFGIEVTLLVVLRSTRLTGKLWKLLQKIKVW